jgi:hypothetical protein
LFPLLWASPVVGGVGGGRHEDVAGSGEEGPEEQGDPADDGPAEEEVEQEDAGDLMAVAGGDDGGEEVDEDKDRTSDHVCGLRGLYGIYADRRKKFRRWLG